LRATLCLFSAGGKPVFADLLARERIRLGFRAEARDRARLSRQTGLAAAALGHSPPVHRR